jgi:cyanophycinase
MKNTNSFSLYFKVFIGMLLSILWQFTSSKKTKGKLFIIGGGHRSDVLMTQLGNTGGFGKKDYVVVLRQPEEPDSAYIYFKVLQN